MKLKKLLKDEKGAVMPLITIILGLLALGFIALVVDLGILYVDKKVMITSADAAALAGAQVLRENQEAIGLGTKTISEVELEAKAAAENYAIANGAEADQVTVYVGQKAVTLPNGDVETREIVDVTSGKNQPLIFARFLDHENSDVMAHAISTWGYVLKSGYFPIFIFDVEYNNYKKEDYVSLHDNVSLGGSKTNSFGFVEVNDTPSMGTIKDAIEGDIAVEPKSAGDILGGVPGKRESVYDSAIERIGDTVLIPVIDSNAFDLNIVNNDINANKWELPVLYFACFKITDVIKQNVEITKQKDGGTKTQKSVEIVGQFTGKTANSNIIVEVDDQINPNPEGEIPATYCKLIK